METELKILHEIAKTISDAGGSVYFVGGYVRDLILGKQNKDIDVEVYGVELNSLKCILNKFGIVDEVGQSFGVLMIHGLPVDFALPRREILAKKFEEENVIKIPYNYDEKYTNLIRSVCPGFEITVDAREKFGHKDFIVIPDPFINLKEASVRRDFTMNAIMKDVMTGEIVDLWGGIKDIQNGVIRHISDSTFIEDPLRVLRACQFASRLEFKIAPETMELCRKIDLSSLPKERILEEIKKALLKGVKPSIAFEYMRQIGVIDRIFPELKDMVGCPQDPWYHPEGDVWNHTMSVIDGGAKLKGKSKNPEVFMLASLLHDVGKPKTTECRDGRITSYNHHAEGEEIARSFLYRITNEKSLIEDVCAIVRNHMRPLSLYPDASDKAIRKLSVDIDIDEILLFAEADSMGKQLNGQSFSEIHRWFKNRMLETGADKGIKPLVTGKDLIALGMKPGREFGDILSKAFDLQLEGMSKDQIIDKILGFI